MTIWAADGERGLMRITGGNAEKCGPPSRAVCSGGGKVFCAGQRQGLCLQKDTGETLFDFALPTGTCALALLGQRLCALSSDADSLCAFCAQSGTILLSAPAGAYPRDMCLSPCGKYLAVAGGAAGEILLFDENLTCVQRRRVPGAACAVCFLPRHLAALCTVGDGELSTRLMLISPRGVAEEIFSWPDGPCSLCALPGGQCLVGCHGAVLCLRPDGRQSFRIPCAYPARIRPFRDGALICDGWQGRILRLNGQSIYQGSEPCDIAITQ